MAGRSAKVPARNEEAYHNKYAKIELANRSSDAQMVNMLKLPIIEVESPATQQRRRRSADDNLSGPTDKTVLPQIPHSASYGGLTSLLRNPFCRMTISKPGSQRAKEVDFDDLASLQQLSGSDTLPVPIDESRKNTIRRMTFSVGEPNKASDGKGTPPPGRCCSTPLTKRPTFTNSSVEDSDAVQLSLSEFLRESRSDLAINESRKIGDDLKRPSS